MAVERWRRLWPYLFALAATLLALSSLARSLPDGGSPGLLSAERSPHAALALEAEAGGALLCSGDLATLPDAPDAPGEPAAAE